MGGWTEWGLSFHTFFDCEHRRYALPFTHLLIPSGKTTTILFLVQRPIGQGLLSLLCYQKRGSTGCSKTLNSCLRQTCEVFGDFNFLELFFTLTVMWITKHFDSKVKPYEDLSVSQDFVELLCYRTKLELISCSHDIPHLITCFVTHHSSYDCILWITLSPHQIIILPLFLPVVMDVTVQFV